MTVESEKIVENPIMTADPIEQKVSDLEEKLRKTTMSDIDREAQLNRFRKNLMPKPERSEAAD